MNEINRFLIEGELTLIELETRNNKTYIIDMHPDERLGFKRYLIHEKGNKDPWMSYTFEGGSIHKIMDELPALGEPIVYIHLMSQIDGVGAKKQVTSPIINMRCLNYTEKNEALDDLREVYSGIIQHNISKGQKRL